MRAKEHLYFLVVCIAPLWIRFPADTLIFILICFQQSCQTVCCSQNYSGKNLSSVFSCLQQLTVVIPPHIAAKLPFGPSPQYATALMNLDLHVNNNV